MVKVSLLRCEAYDARMVKQKLREGLLSIGLAWSLVVAGELLGCQNHQPP